MRESAIQQAVIQHWRALGFPGTLVAAIPNAGALGQPGLHRGLFDLIVMGGTFLRDRTGWIELKAAKGKVSPYQITFGNLCLLSGVPHAITFGRDEPIRVLEEWQVVRRASKEAA